MHLDLENKKEYGIGYKEKYVYTFILYLISPFVLLLLALKNLRTPWAKNVFWIFIIFFGFTMVIGSDGIDSFYYLEDLKRMYGQDLSFRNLMLSFYATDSGVDIFQPLLTFGIALFTDSQKVLFGTFALVFGYFYTRSIWKVLTEVEGNFDYFLKLLIATLLLIIPFWFINGFRFWTAAIIYYYAIIHFLFNKHDKYTLLVFVTPFVHFSFFGPVVIFFIFRVLGNRTFIYFLFFTITIFISEIELTVFNDFFSSYLPELFAERTSGYVHEGNLEAINEKLSKLNWYVDFSKNSILWFLRLGITIVYVNSIFTKVKYKRHISFIFLFGAFANILSSIPSGWRFIIIFNLFAMSYLIIMYKSFKFKRVLYFGIPFLIVFMLVSIREGLDFVNIIAIFGNPLLALIDSNTTALINLIK